MTCDVGGLVRMRWEWALLWMLGKEISGKMGWGVWSEVDDEFGLREVELWEWLFSRLGIWEGKGLWGNDEGVRHGCGAGTAPIWVVLMATEKGGKEEKLGGMRTWAWRESVGIVMTSFSDLNPCQVTFVAAYSSTTTFVAARDHFRV